MRFLDFVKKSSPCSCHSLQLMVINQWNMLKDCHPLPNCSFSQPFLFVQMKYYLYHCYDTVGGWTSDACVPIYRTHISVHRIKLNHLSDPIHRILWIRNNFQGIMIFIKNLNFLHLRILFLISSNVLLLVMYNDSRSLLSIFILLFPIVLFLWCTQWQERII